MGLKRLNMDANWPLRLLRAQILRSPARRGRSHGIGMHLIDDCHLEWKLQRHLLCTWLPRRRAS